MTAAAALFFLLAQAAPSPTASACDLSVDVVKPEYPRDFDLPSEVRPYRATIAVVVGPDGKVRSAKVYKSSGDLEFDMASIRAAKASKYRPQVINCKPVEATYYFLTTLTPNSSP